MCTDRFNLHLNFIEAAWHKRTDKPCLANADIEFKLDSPAVWEHHFHCVNHSSSVEEHMDKLKTLCLNTHTYTCVCLLYMWLCFERPLSEMRVKKQRGSTDKQLAWSQVWMPPVMDSSSSVTTDRVITAADDLSIQTWLSVFWHWHFVQWLS